MSWVEANQRHLTAAVAGVKAALGRHAGQAAAPPPDPPDPPPGPPPALDTVAAAFGLTAFERAVLLLCAGVELDASMSAAVAAAHGDPARAYPTLGLALAALPDPHWSAVTPAGPLRYWRLIEVAPQPGVPLTASPLRIDERVLHYLAGVQYLDDRLAAAEPVPPPGELVPSHRAAADRVAAAWADPAGPPPVVELTGPEVGAKRDAAAAAAADLGLRLCALSADALPADPAEWARLWTREAVLTGLALYVDAGGIDPAAGAAGVYALVERVRGPVALATRDRWRPGRRPAVAVEVRNPTAGEQRALWLAGLGARAAGLNGHVDRLAAQFDLPAQSITASARAAAAAPPAEAAARAWDAGRAQARPRLDDLAERIEPAVGWDALVLPAAERAQLGELAAQVAARATVYGAWGYAAAGSRGLGITALFAGASGTGKTLAAEVLAAELRLDLYRIDLAGVMSRYIGVTEQNLRRVFDAAEGGGAVLFFDEADALFGKRTEVKDSHDRYANIEVNYLLQRMERYRGLAVLATNRKGDLDPAFVRRLRFVVSFPFPGPAERAAIWQRAFPPAAPTEGLDFARLARLEVSGGAIRNIALRAAFLAAAGGGPITMRHARAAARAEFAKMDRPVPATDFGGDA